MTKLTPNPPQRDLYEIVLITDKKHMRRGVAFLISTDRRVTANDAFVKFRRPIELLFRSRFDAWRDNINNPRWYHGWDKSEFGGQYTECFVFKCKDKKLQRRLYGFLCNPKIANRGYQACVLVCHAFKKEHETPLSDLQDTEAMRTTLEVQRAIREYFTEIEDGNTLDRKKH